MYFKEKKLTSVSSFEEAVETGKELLKLSVFRWRIGMICTDDKDHTLLVTDAPEDKSSEVATLFFHRAEEEPYCHIRLLHTPYGLYPDLRCPETVGSIKGIIAEELNTSNVEYYSYGAGEPRYWGLDVDGKNFLEEREEALDKISYGPCKEHEFLLLIMTMLDEKAKN